MRLKIGHEQRLCVAFAVGDDSMDSKGTDQVLFMDQSEGEGTNIVIFMDGGGVILDAKGQIGPNKIIFTQQCGGELRGKYSSDAGITNLA